MSILGYFKKGKSRNRAVIIGLDGVPYRLLCDLMQKGCLPNVRKLTQEGYFASMEVSIPEISSVSWSSFMTGTHPGNHGIFGFVDLKPNSYKLFFPNFLNLKTPTIFDELGNEGKRSVVINLPATYPARKIPGVLISGFVAIDLKRAVYPESLLPHLEEVGYVIDVNAQKARNNPDFLLEELNQTLKIRRKTAEYLWDHEDWDLFMMVVTGTDRLHHFLWHAYEDSVNIHHNAFIDYYREVDTTIGYFVEKFQKLPGSKKDDNHLIILSDHGFTGIKSEVYINRWLQQNGLLSFEKNPPRSLEDINPNATAFALDPSRIYIHTKSRYPKGNVDDGDIERIKEDISIGLKKLSFEDDSPVIKEVFDGKQLYQGPFVSQGPDLVLLSFPGFDLKGKINSERVFGHTDLKGMHTQDDAFFYSDKGAAIKTIFQVKDVVG